MDATSASDMLTVLQYVDHFYATSWNHLLVYSGLAVGAVGLVIPVLIQMYQGWTMRHERKEIRSAIVGQVSAELCARMGQEKALLDEKIDAATQSLEVRLAQDRAGLEQGVRMMEGELRKRIAKTHGSVYHVQTNVLISMNSYKAAFTSGITGLERFIEGEDHVNLRRLLHVISKLCLPQMTKSQFDEMEEEMKDFHRVMAAIKKWDVNNDFADAMIEAKRAFKAACERVPAVKPQGP